MSNNNDVDTDSESDNESVDGDENETSTQKKQSQPDDIGTCVMDTIKQIDVKKIAFIFIIFMIVTSIPFVDGVLAKRHNCVSGVNPTLRGTVVQATCMCLGYVAIDILVTHQLI